MHPVSMLMIVLGILTAGVMSCFFISIDNMPPMPPRSIIIAVKYKGISSDEIRESVTIPLENSVASLRGLKNIESVSRNGLSLLRINLHWGVNVSDALLQSREIIDSVYPRLPSRCEKPVVLRDYGRVETMSLVVIPGDDLASARQIVDSDLRERFQRIPGIGEVRLYGGTKRRVEIHIQDGFAEARGIDLFSIAEMLGNANLEYPAGSVKDGKDELMVKTAALFPDLNAMQSCPLFISHKENSVAIRLSDIGNVSFGESDRESFYLYEGKSCIRLGIVKTLEESPLRVSNRVQREISRMNSQYGNTIIIKVEHDSSEIIKKTLKDLIVAAFFSVLVVLGVIFYVYRSLPRALLLSFIIPVSLILSVSVLYIFGKTINVISLTGLAIGIGMVVDAGTVVMESIIIYRKKRGLLNTETIESAVYAVSRSNTGSAITTCIVFLPVFLMNGLIPSLFSDIAISVIASVIISCLLSVTALPSLICILIKQFNHDVHEDVLLVKLTSWYKNNLIRTLANGSKSMVITIICILIGCIAWSIIPFELFPKLSAQTAEFSITFPAETSLEEIEQYGKDMYVHLNRLHWIRFVSLRCGIEVDNYSMLADPKGIKNKLIVVYGWDRPQNLDEARWKKEILSCFDSTRCSITYAPEKNCLDLPDDIFFFPVVIQADSPQKSLASATKILYNTPSGVIIPFVGTEQFVFKPNRYFCSQYGIEVSRLAGIVHAGLEGVETAPFYEKGIQIPVFVFLEKNQPVRTQDISRMKILVNGTSVPVLSAGSIDRELTENILYRYNRKDARILEGFNPETVRIPSDIQLIDIKKVETEEISHEIIIMLLGVILLLYFVLAAQFESFIVPIFLLFALPAAFSGAMVLLLVFGKTVNVMSGIALVLLFGTAVNNSILLYESISSKKQINSNSIIIACTERFRTILVTATTTIGALLPFSFDPYSKYAQSSLAIAVIGGMVLSTLLVLFIVPKIFFKFYLFERIKNNE